MRKILVEEQSKTDVYRKLNNWAIINNTSNANFIKITNDRELDI